MENSIVRFYCKSNRVVLKLEQRSGVIKTKTLKCPSCGASIDIDIQGRDEENGVVRKSYWSGSLFDWCGG